MFVITIDTKDANLLRYRVMAPSATVPDSAASASKSAMDRARTARAASTFVQHA